MEFLKVRYFLRFLFFYVVGKVFLGILGDSRVIIFVWILVRWISIVIII